MTTRRRFAQILFMIAALAMGSCRDTPPATPLSSEVSGDTDNGDANRVAEAKDALSASSLTFESGESASAVKSGFTVPLTVGEDVTVTWSSSSSFLSVSGSEVTLSIPDEDTLATLTATLSKGEASDTKQIWLTLKAGRLIFGGRRSSSGVAPGYWTAPGSFTALPITGGADGRQNVSRIYAVGEDLYLSGTTGLALNSPAYWKNSTRYDLATLGGDECSVAGMAFDGSTVLTAGTSKYDAGNENFIYPAGVWTGTDWAALANSGEVSDILHLGTSTYVFGAKDGSPGYWINGAWTTLPVLDASDTTRVTRCTSAASDIYCAGSQQGNSFLALYWENGVVTELEVSGSASASTSDIQVVGSDVYIAGTVDGKAGYWINGTWVPTSSTPNGGARTSGILVVGTNVYLTGSIYIDNGEESTAGYWKNGIWTALEGVASDYTNVVDAVILPPL